MNTIYAGKVQPQIDRWLAEDGGCRIWFVCGHTRFVSDAAAVLALDNGFAPVCAVEDCNGLAPLPPICGHAPYGMKHNRSCSRLAGHTGSHHDRHGRWDGFHGTPPAPLPALIAVTPVCPQCWAVPTPGNYRVDHRERHYVCQRCGWTGYVPVAIPIPR